ncbi:CDF-like metal transporter [Thelephora terrestris]|uniref:CDF-like metal transporter n=1 Tax=Thelephora terrestris TaxID=56493 RepID=A0A9P6HJW1_9AGAM|nr:CDF-like metal transporter [Thelephora terrestris]
MSPPRVSDQRGEVDQNLVFVTKGKAPPSNGDVEGSTSIEIFETDPFSFRNGIKTDEELVVLRQRKKGKTLESYHRKQNELIDNLLKPMAVHTQEARDSADAARLSVKIAVYASMFANIALSIIQVYAAVSSLSLSFFATAVDSVFDPMSNILLWWLNRKSNKLDTNKWPVGGARLETIGNICYGILMFSVNLIVIVESVHSIITHKPGDSDHFFIPAVASVASALGVKFVLFLYCSAVRKSSSQVQVLWEDHRNDLFINGFGLFTSAGGSKWIWYLDPMGAIIIAAGVSGAWVYRIYREFELLAGKSAPHEFIQLLIYKAMMFSSEIEKIDTVRAYHSGPNYFVEIDIVMAANTPLWKAHDISQQLQDTIEILPNVERAFVHVDHETTHVPEHRKFL